MRSTICLAFTLLLINFKLSSQVIEMTILDTGKVQISKHIYGHFAEHLGRCIYDGFYRNGKTRADIIKALKKIKVPNLRWPGGCFADQYHWKNGIGTKTKRPKTINTTWGMVTEDNSFGTHEFLALCDSLNCEPYIAGNVGTGSPQEMSDWIEYLNFNGKSTLSSLRASNGHPKPYNVAFWGVGNESWGCGGEMTPEYYANLYKQFASFCQNYPGAPLKKVIGGANSDDYNWTEVCLKNINPASAWGISLHYYTWLTGNWPPTGSATSFPEQEYFDALSQCQRIEEILEKHIAIMDKYDPVNKLALVVDEWGIWTKAEPGTNPKFLFQQNSLRDAIIAASTLNIFNNQARRVKMANLAQAVNVIHSVILTSGDSMLLTPTYHIFDMMKVHQNARQCDINFTSPKYSYNSKDIKAINASASIDSNGKHHITLVNIDPNTPYTIKINAPATVATGQILTSAKFDDHNTFLSPEKVKLKPFTSIHVYKSDFTITIPAKSVLQIQWE